MTLLAVCGDASTTTAFALARSWPADGVLLVEADPTGGDLAAWFDRPERPGVATAVTQASAGSWPQIASQLQPADGVDTLLMPIRSGEAEVAGREAGVRLAPTLAALDSVIAIADCGSVNPNVTPTMVSQAALVALTIRQPTTSARAAAAHLDRVSEVFDALRARGVATVVVVVGETPYRASEIAEFLSGTASADDDVAPVNVITLADDPFAAAAIAGRHRSRYRFERSALGRSARAAAAELQVRLVAAASAVPAGVMS